MRKNICHINVLLLGRAATGKSSLILRYTQNLFIESSNRTVGIDFAQTNLKRNDQTLRLVLWDTAGQETYRAAVVGNLKNKGAVIFVYSVDKLNSLDELIDFWIPKAVEKCAEETIFVAFGNKTDLVDDPTAVKKAADAKLQRLSEEIDRGVESFVGSCKLEGDAGVATMM
jgi:small GTP-binding protein